MALIIFFGFGLLMQTDAGLVEIPLDKTLDIAGMPHRVWVRQGTRQRLLLFQDNTTLQDMVLRLELFVRAEGEKRARRLWVREEPQGAAGRPVLDVTVGEGKQSTLLLAIADNYYPSHELVEISLHGDLPDEAEKHIQNEAGNWEPTPSWVHFPPLLETAVPRDLMEQTGGTSHISVRHQDGQVLLEVTPSHDLAYVLEFQPATQNWRRLEGGGRD